jgi:8-oxo-dGTP pyrophosphatase MutT (NUDIX family)
VSKLDCSGALIVSRDTKRFLLLQRTQNKTQGMWALVGGKSEPVDRSPLDTLNREIAEELGFLPVIEKIIPLDLYTSLDGHFSYGTYVAVVDKEFVPCLNGEHSGYCWCQYGYWPKPLHQGLKTSVNNRIVKMRLELVLDLI